MPRTNLSREKWGHKGGHCHPHKCRRKSPTRCRDIILLRTHTRSVVTTSLISSLQSQLWGRKATALHSELWRVDKEGEEREGQWREID